MHSPPGSAEGAFFFNFFPHLYYETYTAEPSIQVGYAEKVFNREWRIFKTY
jgi:hypothetical protein